MKTFICHFMTKGISIFLQYWPLFGLLKESCFCLRKSKFILKAYKLLFDQSLKTIKSWKICINIVISFEDDKSSWSARTLRMMTCKLPQVLYLQHHTSLHFTDEITTLCHIILSHDPTNGSLNSSFINFLSLKTEIHQWH